MNMVSVYVELISIPIQSFSSSAILEMIDPADLAEIKKKDEHPFFKAWVVAHEGVSLPRIAGQANPIKVSWTKKAIQAMASAVTKGIKFFSGHNSDNSTAGRPALGEIVASKNMMIGGKLSNVIVGYFPPATRDEVQKKDVCSMEAVWDMIKTGATHVAEGIKTITGIALGNGDFDKPAFAGAGELASVQAFENQGENKMSEITFRDVENFVKKNRVLPRQLYSWDDVLGDRDFAQKIEEIEKREKEKAAELEKLTADHLTLKTEHEKSALSLQRIEAQDKIEELVKEKPEKLKNLILKKAKSWERFDEESINKQLSAVEEDYNELMAGQDDDTSLPSTDKQENDKEDLTKAENNELLTEDA